MRLAMPSKAKVRWAQLRVTVMAICSLSILSVVVYLLTRDVGIFSPRTEIRTLVGDASGIGKGMNVRLNGILIGTVTSVALSGNRDPAKTVEIRMEVDRRLLASVPEDSVAGISAETLLGDMYVDIARGRSRVPLPPGGELKSLPPVDLTKRADLMKALQSTLRQADALLSDIDAGRGPVGEFVKGEAFYRSLNSSVDQVRRDISAMGRTRDLLGRMLSDPTLYDEVRAPILRLTQSLTELQNRKFLRDPAQYDDIRSKVLELRRILDDLNAGKGSGGRLLKSDQMYVRLSRQLDQLQVAVDSLNAGEGAIGQLLVNAQLYESMNGATRDLGNTLRELRQNPQKFLRLKVF
jgi:phospholipid/cholesterol/gamma-HCH transport system substrate-binding protein